MLFQESIGEERHPGLISSDTCQTISNINCHMILLFMVYRPLFPPPPPPQPT